MSFDQTKLSFIGLRLLLCVRSVFVTIVVNLRSKENSDQKNMRPSRTDSHDS